MEENIKLNSSQENSEVIFKKQSQSKEIWRRFKKSKGAVVGLFVLAAIILALIFADLITPYSAATTQQLSAKLQGPSAAHLLGTDAYGRDVLARILHGGRTSLSIAILATISSCIFGSALGAIAGYFGGKVDNIMMRIVDVIYSIPMMIYVILLMVIFGAGLRSIIIALAVSYWLTMARIVRGQILSLKQQEFVLAARTLGAPHTRRSPETISPLDRRVQ
jgi:oligopeptide transport system permease protein